MFITSITIITALLGVICPAEREDAFSFVWANNETRKLLGETHNSTNSYLSFDYKNDLKLVKRSEVENEGSEFLDANNEFSSTSDGIYGDDDRVFLQNNEYTYYPFKAVCQLFVSYDNFVGTYLGTGALVGPNILLTAAHMVYDAQKGWAHLVAKPGYNSALQYPSQYGSATSIAAVIGLNATTHSPNDDWAICKLNCNLGYEVGYFSVASPSLFNGMGLRNYAYNGSSGRQSKADGSICEFGSYSFCHQIDAVAGSSGSPIVQTISPNSIIGIHSGGIHEWYHDHNLACRVTPTMVGDVNERTVEWAL